MVTFLRKACGVEDEYVFLCSRCGREFRVNETHGVSVARLDDEIHIHCPKCGAGTSFLHHDRIDEDCPGFDVPQELAEET